MENFVDNVENSAKTSVENAAKAVETAHNPAKTSPVRTMRGEHEVTIDAKNGRISVPPSFRALLGGGFYIAKNSDEKSTCLRIYTNEAWNSFESGLYEKIEAEEDVWAFLRIINCNECELDKQGRFSIPAKLRKYAGLRENVTIVGMGQTAEIWDTEAFEERTANYDMALAARIKNSGLAKPRIS